MLLRILTGLMLVALFSFGQVAAVAAAQIVKTLDDNVRITPPGIIVATASEIPKFKKGTVVTLNEFGEVLEGTLADNISLPYETGLAADSVRATKLNYTPMPYYIVTTQYLKPTRLLPFKGGTKVVFNDKGEVVYGTVNNPGEPILLNLVNQIAIAEGELSFHKNGMVAICTLAGDSYLRPVGWRQLLTDNFADGTACPGFVEFKGGKPVRLNEKGEVIKGTLNKDAKLLTDSLMVPGVGGKRIYEAGTTVEFDDKGLVVKATKG